MARNVSVLITGDSSSLDKALAGSAAGADAASKEIGDSFDGASSRVGGIFERLGSTLGNWGIPFSESISNIGSKFDDADTKGQKFGSAMSTLGGAALLGVGVAIAGVSAESIHLATSFDSTVTSIAASANIPVAAAQKIGAAFLDTAGTTIYSGQEIATAYSGVAGQLGTVNGKALDASQAMIVMRAAMNLAEGSGTSLSGATADVSKALQSFGLGITSSPLVSNVLFNASRETGTSVDALTASLTKVRAQMGAGGQSIQTMSGLLVDMAEHGAGTSGKALTVLGTVMTSLLTPSAATADAQVGLLGHQFVNAQGNLEPLNQIIGEVSPKIAGMGEAAGVAELKALGFGAGANKLYETIKAGSPALDTATAAVSRSGSAADAADKQSKTFQHTMETLKSTAEDYGVKIGNVLIPKLEDLGKAVANVIEWFTKHKAAAIAVAGVIGGILVTAIAAYTVSMASAAVATIAATWPILLIILAVAALALGIAYLATHWKQSWTDIKNWFDDAVKFLRSGFGTLALLIAGPIAPLLFLALHWQAIWSSIRAVVDDTWHAIDNDVLHPLEDFFTNTIPHALSVVSGAFTTGFQSIHNIVNTVWHAIDNDFIQPLVNFFTDTIPHAIGTMVGFFTAIPGEVNHVWSDVVNALHSAWSDIANWVSSNIVQPVVNFFTSIPGAVNHVWSDVVNALHSAWSTIANWVTSTIVQPVVNFFESIPGAVAHVWTDVETAIHSAWSDVANWVNSTLVQPVEQFFTSIPGTVDHVWTDIRSAISSALGDVAAWFLSEIVLPIVQGFADIADAAAKGFGWVPGVGSGLRDAASAANGAVATIQADIDSLHNPPPITISVITQQSTVQGVSAAAGIAATGAFLGARAGGGPVVGSTPYVIGENGPEIFVPSSSGVVVPNSVFSTSGPSFSSSGGGSGSGSAVPLHIDLILDGQKFATAVLPDLRTALYQNKRAVGTLQMA